MLLNLDIFSLNMNWRNIVHDHSNQKYLVLTTSAYDFASGGFFPVNFRKSVGIVK